MIVLQLVGKKNKIKLRVVRMPHIVIIILYFVVVVFAIASAIAASIYK